MRKNGVLERRNPYLEIRRIFLEEDKSRAMIRLNGYATGCLNRKSPTAIKRAGILKELMKTL